MTNAPRVLVYAPDETPLCELDASQLVGLVRTEEINGEHSITVITTEQLQKASRLVYQDNLGVWREYVVRGVDEDHLAGNKPTGKYYAVWSLQDDLMGVVVSRAEIINVTAATALGYAVENTARWTVGTVTQATTASGSMYSMSAWEALAALVKYWGGEVDATITVDDSGVVARAVNLYAQQGSATAVRRCDYGRDVSSIKRKEAETKVTPRVIPRGAITEADGGITERVGIETVNSGTAWLEDTASAAIYRLPDGVGGWEYPTQIIVNEEIDDPQELKNWALGVFEQYTRPKVTYEANVVQLTRAGMDAYGVALGDVAQVVDRTFGSAGLRISGRVIKIVADELDSANTVITIGNRDAALVAKYKAASSAAEVAHESHATASNALTTAGTALTTAQAAAQAATAATLGKNIAAESILLRLLNTDATAHTATADDTAASIKTVVSRDAITAQGATIKFPGPNQTSANDTLIAKTTSADSQTPGYKSGIGQSTRKIVLAASKEPEDATSGTYNGEDHGVDSWTIPYDGASIALGTDMGSGPGIALQVLAEDDPYNVAPYTQYGGLWGTRLVLTPHDLSIWECYGTGAWAKRATLWTSASVLCSRHDGTYTA